MSDEPLPGQSDIFDVLGVVTVHCFFQRWCQHFETSDDPAEAHRRMESHYEEKHYGHHLETVRQEVDGKAWRSTNRP